MTDPELTLPERISRLIDEALASPNPRGRYDSFVAMLAKDALGKPPTEVRAGAIGALESTFMKRLEEWGETPIKVVILMDPADPRTVQYSVDWATKRAHTVVRKRQFLTDAILVYARTSPGAIWTLRTLVEYDQQTLGHTLIQYYTPFHHATVSREVEFQPKPPPPLRVWMEFAAPEPANIDGEWEQGTCLWAPLQAPNGEDFYALMRALRAGDWVLHFLEDRLVGMSQVRRGVELISTDRSVAGSTPGRGQYYRIDLVGMSAVPVVYSIAQLIQDHGEAIERELLSHPRLYPFHLSEGTVTLRDNVYLARCTELLYALLERETQIPSWSSLRTAVVTEPRSDSSVGLLSYAITDAVDEVFLAEQKLARVLAVFQRKRNLILEGPPGVGKTFLARRLAFALIGQRDPARVEVIQFHPSYAYEDFVRGWRPAADGLAVRNGRFLCFCHRARRDLGRRYVFIIDEINRGNLATIFGDLLMLVEGDKRNAESAILLSQELDEDPYHDEQFFIPPNVYVLGLMNTADRSLALVDYALRRRFAFFALEPAFDAPGFADLLRHKGADANLVDRIKEEMTAVNAMIKKSRELGPGFAIGHSYFCPTSGDVGVDAAWYSSILDTEIVPLLYEYWADSPSTLKECLRILGKDRSD